MWIFRWYHRIKPVHASVISSCQLSRNPPRYLGCPSLLPQWNREGSVVVSAFGPRRQCSRVSYSLRFRKMLMRICKKNHNNDRLMASIAEGNDEEWVPSGAISTARPQNIMIILLFLMTANDCRELEFLYFQCMTCEEPWTGIIPGWIHISKFPKSNNCRLFFMILVYLFWIL